MGGGPEAGGDRDSSRRIATSPAGTPRARAGNDGWRRAHPSVGPAPAGGTSQPDRCAGSGHPALDQRRRLPEGGSDRRRCEPGRNRSANHGESETPGPVHMWRGPGCIWPYRRLQFSLGLGDWSCCWAECRKENVIRMLVPLIFGLTASVSPHLNLTAPVPVAQSTIVGLVAACPTVWMGRW